MEEQNKTEYNCSVCHQKVSGKNGHMYLDFRDNQNTMSREICEVCAGYFVEFLKTLETSANLFYQSGIKKKMRIIFDD